MEALELQAEPRDVVGRHVKALRKQGLVPAIVYGRNQESTPLQIEGRALGKVLNEAGTHQLISLKVGNEKARLALARDIQRDVVRLDYLHVDFYVVIMDEKVTAQVPLVLIGEAPAVEKFGGVLTQGLDELEIECLPGDLISSIEVNVDSLTELNDTISVVDLKVPDTVTILSDTESMIAKVEPPRIVAEDEEEEEELLEAPVSAEPEVITASKREDEE